MQRPIAGMRCAGTCMPGSYISIRAGTPLGQRYAALCTACSIAERVRDNGGHALVVLDDISCMVRFQHGVVTASACGAPSVKRQLDCQLRTWQALGRPSHATAGHLSIQAMDCAA